MQKNDIDNVGDLSPSCNVLCVKGAGTEDCNGVYELQQKNSYVHQGRVEYAIQLVSGGTWVLKHEDSFLYQLQM